jgi:hypothetical protein
VRSRQHNPAIYRELTTVGKLAATGTRLSQIFTAMGSETRTIVQARIAASAPKNTYGKHKNKLLPLTGSQFFRDDVYGNITKRIAAKDTTSRIDQESSADDSPLSDAEPRHKVQRPQSAVARIRRTISLTKNTTTVKPSRRKKAVDVPNTRSDTGNNGYLALSQSPHRHKPGVDRRKPHRPATSAQKAGKLKPAGVARGRLPFNELLLVPGPCSDEDPSKISKRTHAAMVRDPISSSAQPLLDAVGSSDSEAEVTPTKRKAKVPLSAIRKRLRTPSSGHKSLERLRRKYNAAQFTTTGSQPRQIVGDGFESSELISSHPSRRMIKHARKQREPLLAGLQALSLVSGPLPETEFTGETSTSQLGIKHHDTPALDEDTPEHDTPVNVAPVLGKSGRSSNRCVSFDHDAEHVISAQLASISAPQRQPSIIIGIEHENDQDDDDGDEGGDEDEDDDEAADTYLDQDELPREGGRYTAARSIEEIQPPLPDAALKSGVPASTFNQRSQGGLRLVDSRPNGFVADVNRQRTLGLRRRTFSGKPLLNEVNESIDDDFRVDDMLLDDEGAHDSIPDHSSAGRSSFDNLHNVRDLTGKDGLTRSSSRRQTQIGEIPSMQPRSILKNSTPHISSESNRPKSTAANTRRNSMTDVEESRYFNAAKDQLDSQGDSTPTKQTIIRKKSSSRFFYPIEVPYSEEVVRETSPQKPDYTNTSQLHVLRRTNEAFWTSSAAIVPQTDLRSLTRSVSKDNGTLSQSVRRRSSLRFQSPMKVSDRW